MISVEALVEDRSGSVILGGILDAFTSVSDTPFSYRLHPHRGIGSPRFDWNRRPDPMATTLFALLPAELRAYNRVLSPAKNLVIIVFDADDGNPENLKETVGHMTRKFLPDLPAVIGVAVEELESWLLGDVAALKSAYPDGHFEHWKSYRQDSVCGTWEVLCRIIMGSKAEELIALGYPAVGQFKYEWAERIAPHLSVETNASPSLHRFIHRLESVMSDMTGASN